MPRITASVLYNHLTCPHRVTMDAFADPARRARPSPFLQLLWERGSLLEAATIARLGQPFADLSRLAGEQKEAATRAAIARGEPLIYGGRLSADELLGEPDLLRREGGHGKYVAIDIKSGAGAERGDDEVDEGRPIKRYGVQIALYTDLLRRLGVVAGDYGYIWDLHGAEVRYELHAPRTQDRNDTLWNAYLEAREAVSRALAAAPETPLTTPAAAGVCKLCVWREACLAELRRKDDLTLLPELGRARRDVLAPRFPTVAALARANIEPFVRGTKTKFPRVGAKMLRKFQALARLQAAGHDAQPYLTAPLDHLPRSTVEVYFDLEDDPLRDHVYLHGFLIREGGDNATERYVAIWAEEVTAAAEREAFARAWTLMRQHEESLLVYYSKHERTKYRRLAERHPGICAVAEIDALFRLPRSLDLYHDLLRAHSVWPTTDYSIKTLAKYLRFAWRDSDPSGAASIEWFDQWVKSRDPAVKQRLLEYNEDDCRAMRVVLDAVRQMQVRPQ